MVLFYRVIYSKYRVAEWFHATRVEVQQHGGNELAEKLLHSPEGIYAAE